MGMCQHELLVSVHKYISPPHVQSFYLSVQPILVCQDIVAGQWKMLIITSANFALSNELVKMSPHWTDRTSTVHPGLTDLLIEKV